MNELFRNIVQDSANSARDRATWQGANAVERATFGKIFNFIEGILGLVAVFGCVAISGAMQNQKFLLYLCGALWIAPFIAVGALLARFRHSLFVRLRSVMNNFLGGSR